MTSNEICSPSGRASQFGDGTCPTARMIPPRSTCRRVLVATRAGTLGDRGYRLSSRCIRALHAEFDRSVIVVVATSAATHFLEFRAEWKGTCAIRDASVAPGAAKCAGAIDARRRVTRWRHVACACSDLGVFERSGTDVARLRAHVLFVEQSERARKNFLAPSRIQMAPHTHKLLALLVLINTTG
jgi:hypothetical protein